MAEEITKLINDFRENHAADLKAICHYSSQLLESCRAVHRAWSGSFAGWHGKMYFHGFKPPLVNEAFSGEWGGINGIPDGWEEKENEEVRSKIEHLVGDGFSVVHFEKVLQELRRNFLILQEEIVLHYDSFDFESLSPRKRDLALRVEKYDFGKTMVEFINDGMPKSITSRDSEALRQGTCLPSWLYYEGVALGAQTLCEKGDEFFRLVERLLAAIGHNRDNEVRTVAVGPLGNLHRDIYDKCHELFEKNAYAEAVEKGFKVVRDKLRQLTGFETGSEAFGKGGLHIKGAAAPHVDADFNDGVKFLAMAVDRFRNEKSHTSDSKIDDPIRAYEYLRLSSLAMNLLEDAEILP